jgi:hypothetical protein
VTGDGWPDVIARQPGIEGGALWAYTHSKNAPPLGVFAAKTLIGKGWNVHNWIGVGELTGDTPEYETTAEAPADILARRASDGALMIYPHSGTFNGTTTFLPPVVVGLGWNKFEALLLGDINTDGFDDIWAVDNDAATSYVYFHSGRFNGTATFRSAVVMGSPSGHEPIEWDFLTTWSRENPDLVGVRLDTSEIISVRHTNKYNGLDTWDRDPANAWWLARSSQFTYATTLCVFLMDVDGDGDDDLVKSMPNGALMYYPFLGWRSSPALGSPVQIGSGWHTMDLIT